MMHSSFILSYVLRPESRSAMESRMIRASAGTVAAGRIRENDCLSCLSMPYISDLRHEVSLMAERLPYAVSLLHNVTR